MKLICTTLQSAVSPHPSTKDSTSVLLFACKYVSKKPKADGQRKRSLHTWWRSCITVKLENTALVSNEIHETTIDHVISQISYSTIVHRVKCHSRMIWMQHAKTSQLSNIRKDTPYQKILPKMPCQRRYQV